MGQEEYSRPLLKNLETTGVQVELYLGTAVGSYSNLVIVFVFCLQKQMLRCVSSALFIIVFYCTISIK